MEGGGVITYCQGSSVIPGSLLSSRGSSESPLFPLGFVAADPGPTLVSPSHSCPGELLVMVLTSPSVHSRAPMALCRCLNPAGMPTEVPTVSSSGERCTSIQAQVHPWAHGAQLPTRACSLMPQGRVCTLKPLTPLALRPHGDSAGALSNTQVTAPPSTERKSLSWDLSSQPTQAGRGARHVCRGV